MARNLVEALADVRAVLSAACTLAAFNSAGIESAAVATAPPPHHAARCVAEAFASGSEDEQREKFGELIDLIEKAKR
ncbi:transcriptional regulator [Croceicoccus pelagius]|uniref:Uncharacterized protein n=1 Tax=Croceicoccus pelagius TaxID=1703341 RepID=A0A916YBI9_9SPHN|nr:transcriptional regulator [Croceicoccus pelagius]GGD38084.1 hypothetical protein GCM10010989_10250 [Croceicoccus pelagius]